MSNTTDTKSLQNVKHSDKFLTAFNELCRADYLKPGGEREAPIVIYRQKAADALLIEQGDTHVAVDCSRYDPEADWREMYVSEGWEIIIFTPEEIDADAAACATTIFNYINDCASDRVRGNQ